MRAGLFLRNDVAVGFVLLAFGVVATALALDIPRGPVQRTLTPATVPLMCTVGIGLCGLALLVRGLMVDQAPVRMPMDRRQAVTLALFAAFFLAFEDVDYRLLLALFVPSVMFTLGCRSWKQLVGVTVAVIAGIWIFFVELFDVFLTTWI